MNGRSQARAGRAAVVASACLLVGCDLGLGFTAPDESSFADRRPLVSGYLEVRTGDEPTARFRATLFPGRDGRGELRGVSDDRIEVLKWAAAPRSVEADGIRRYEEEWEVSAGYRWTPGEMVPPFIEGLDEPVPVLRFAVCERDGEGEVAVVPGEPVVLPVACPGTLDLGDSRGFRWNLSVRQGGTGSEVLSIRAVGEPPGAIMLHSVPGKEDEDDPDFVAILQVIEQLARDDPEDPYHVGLSVVSTSSWVLREAK